MMSMLLKTVSWSHGWNAAGGTLDWQLTRSCLDSVYIIIDEARKQEHPSLPPPAIVVLGDTALYKLNNIRVIIYLFIVCTAGWGTQVSSESWQKKKEKNVSPQIRLPHIHSLIQELLLFCVIHPFKLQLCQRRPCDCAQLEERISPSTAAYSSSNTQPLPCPRFYKPPKPILIEAPV